MRSTLGNNSVTLVLAGTAAEVALAVKNQRPVILLGFDAGGLFAEFQQSGQLTTAANPQDAVTQAAALLDPASAGDPA